MGEHNILVVDDVEFILKAVRKQLREMEGLREVYTTQKPEEALEMLAQREYAVVLSDFQMPGMDGVEFLRKVKEQYPNIVRLLMTGTPEELQKRYPGVLGSDLVYMVLEKPDGVLTIQKSVQDAVDFYEKQKTETRE